jgi:hypothetical protein
MQFLPQSVPDLIDRGRYINSSITTRHQQQESGHTKNRRRVLRHGRDTVVVSLSRPYHRKQHSLIRGATPLPASDPFGSRLRQQPSEEGFMDLGASVPT